MKTLVVLVLAAMAVPRVAGACDAYAERTVVGFSADGKVAVLRTEWRAAMSAIDISLYDLDKELTTEKFTVLDEKDNGDQKLRKQRWEKIQADLLKRGFKLATLPELPTGKGTDAYHLPTFRVDAVGASLTQPVRPADEEMFVDIDLAVAGAKRSAVLQKALYHQMASATEMGYLVRAYLSPDGKRVIAIDRGACVEPNVVVLPLERLKAALAGK